MKFTMNFYTAARLLKTALDYYFREKVKARLLQSNLGTTLVQVKTSFRQFNNLRPDLIRLALALSINPVKRDRVRDKDYCEVNNFIRKNLGLPLSWPGCLVKHCFRDKQEADDLHRRRSARIGADRSQRKNPFPSRAG